MQTLTASEKSAGVHLKLLPSYKFPPFSFERMHGKAGKRIDSQFRTRIGGGKKS